MSTCSFGVTEKQLVGWMSIEVLPNASQQAVTTLFLVNPVPVMERIDVTKETSNTRSIDQRKMFHAAAQMLLEYKTDRVAVLLEGIVTTKGQRTVTRSLGRNPTQVKL